MTPHAIRLHRRAQRDLQDIRDKPTLRRVRDTIDHLATDPLPWRTHDLAKLEGRKNTYRIRLGDLRIIYQLQERDTLLIMRVAPRGKAYKATD